MSDSLPQQDTDLPAGTKIGFYEVVGRSDATGRIITRVGSGGFGWLYRVQREGTDYALKMSKLKMSELGDDARKHSEDRFRREVSILLALSHPNIVRVHAFDYWPTRDGHPFLIMDFIDGERLYQWRRKAVPSLRSICEVFIKTSLALQELHRHGIFHRDIKSDNLVVRPDGDPVLLDMGIARSGANYTVTGERNMLGTFTQFSPEQCRFYFSEEFQRGGRFELTPPSELHCLGYMLYEVLTGRPPFPPAADDFALMRSIIDTVPVPPSMVNALVPGALDSVVMRLLEKDPDSRHESGQVLAEDLDRVVADASDSSWDAPFDVPAPLAHDAPTPPARRHAARSVSAERAVKKPVSAERPVVASSPGPVGAPKSPSVDGRQPPKLDGPFSPPTVDKRPKFQSPLVSARAAAPASPEQPLNLHGEMAKAVAKLNTATRAAQRARTTPLLVGMAVLVVIGGVLMLMSQGARTPKPKNLLAEMQKNEKVLAADAVVASATAPRAPPPNAAAALAPPPPALVPSSAMTEFQKPAASAVEKKAAPQNRNLREIDAEIAREYGRPTIPPGTKGKPSGAPDRTTAAPAQPRPEQPSWLQVATPQEPAVKAAGVATAAAGTLAPAPRYGVPTGAHIRARLQTNLDSRTVGSGPVEATLMRPFLANGKAIFPSRTMVYGAAQTSGARFTIRFTRVRLPDDTEIQFEGLAYDTGERKPGLPGRVVGAPVVQSGNNTGGKVAAAVANTALGAVGGDLAHDAAREAGQVVLRDATSSDGQVGSGSALLLDAGQDFDVFVSKPF